MHRIASRHIQHFVLGLAAAAALTGFPRAAHAESVYKCRGADGAIAFQDRPCALAKAQTIVEIAPAPPVAESPDYGISPRRAGKQPRTASAPSRERREPVSYECRAADGETFYRHGACPKQIAAPASTSKRKHSGKGGQTYPVSAEPMPRGEVCRKLASAGSIGRRGHEHDESISSYDRNLGRDPCRYL